MRQEQKLPVREAATWFARMHGPDAANHSVAFEAWIANDQANRTAYSQVAETFSLGKNLPRSLVPNAASVRPAPGVLRRALVPAAIALVVALGAARFVINHFNAALIAPQPEVAQAHRFGTPAGQVRTIRLEDGSSVILDAGAELNVAMGSGQRDLWLLHGRARFDVAHEPRPFVVHAGTGTVTAHGTLFDVVVMQGQVSVRLLRGAIDVAVARSGGAGPTRRQVKPGEAVGYDAVRGIEAIPAGQALAIAQPTWPATLLDFDRARVSDVLNQANRYSAQQLVVASPELAERAVSGTFRMGDPDRLAHDLAILLDAKVEHQANGDLVLRAATP